MPRFKEISHDDTRKEPMWRLFCDERKRYRIVVEFDENFTQRDISRIENSLSGAMHDLYRQLQPKFAPPDSK